MKATNKSKVWIKLLLLCMITLSSCKSKHHVSIRNYDRKELSQLYGFAISNHDNLNLYREAAIWLNTPHCDGGTGNSCIDCSYFVYLIYKTVYNQEIARNSRDIFSKNCKEISKNRLQEGDLVFFNTMKSRSNPISHVGIYLKDGKFIHTSTSKGVMVSSLDEDYYRKAWICAGRVR
ncbi:C40 family peptidase [Parabacteroides sp. FAFU027]|uniref:C40 family peptidase n=1 Tax=Parabacteroides sp. FAFU027 TaxID=2922715 RepID=UPI001FAFF5BC|nr:C40 family peptidase [Parabacteroides sp. FAFU027]